MSPQHTVSTSVPSHTNFLSLLRKQKQSLSFSNQTKHLRDIMSMMPVIGDTEVKQPLAVNGLEQVDELLVTSEHGSKGARKAFDDGGVRESGLFALEGNE